MIISCIKANFAIIPHDFAGGELENYLSKNCTFYMSSPKAELARLLGTCLVSSQLQLK